MKIYPILNNLGKGKYVFIFILNERAVVDYVGNQHYVFNIRGNNYRLVVVVKFTIGMSSFAGLVLIKITIR